MKNAPLWRLRVSRNTALVAMALVLFAAYLPTVFVKADADPSLIGGTPVSGYSGSATPITDLQLAGTGNPTVPVKLRVNNGSLTMSTTTGLTFTGSSTGSTLQFSGTLNNVNTALATLTYTRVGTGSDTLEASLVNAGEVFFPGNNHLYEYVSYNSSWVSANANATTRTKYGATGYLTTITSQAENDFVSARLLNAGWMGASDSASEGDWKWVAGPENGISFWSGGSGGSSVSGRYSNWGSGEPNNSSDEDCAQFLTGGTGKWNDLNCSSQALPGYVVEYGSNESPIEISSKNVSITTAAANQYPTISSMGPTARINGSWTNNTAPSLSFNATDPDSSNTVAYQIIIDDTSDFSSPVISYTSAQATQGSKTFTVGQTTGAGTYTVGTEGQVLSEGQYYWRVRATDNVGATGAYSTANSGGVAFRVDVSAPAQPVNLAASTPENDNTPTWSWDAIASTGANSGSVTIEWSQDHSFGSEVSSAAVNWPAATSYTHSTPLADGIWFFRIRATDSAGNTSAYSNVSTLDIDTTAPSIPGRPTTGKTATKDNTPTWQWAASTDIGTGLHSAEPYTVEWSTEEDFGSIMATDTATTNGFTIPNADKLGDGTWYFRVKAQDRLGNVSGYSPAGTVLIDSTPPSIPSKPLLMNGAKNDTPIWEWQKSTDEGAGLDTVPYLFEWSKSADFSGTVYTNAAEGPLYAHNSKLTSGTWYSRVKAQDAVGNVSNFSQSATLSIAAPRIVTLTSTSQPAVQKYDTPLESSSGEFIQIPDAIVLNVFKEYTGSKGKGKTLNLSQNQVIFFSHKGNEHTITIKLITSDYVIVTVASTPTDIKIYRGTTATHDVDNDDRKDISISFAAITGDKAQMKFKQLSAAQPFAHDDKATFNIWPYVIAGIVVLVIYAAARKKLSKPEGTAG